MEAFLTNEGLCHIVNHISSFSDPKSLAQCRKVCHSWKNSIDNDRRWLILQLEHIQKKEKIFIDWYKNEKTTMTILERFPEWNAVVKQFSRNRNIPRLKEFVQYMWIYFNDESINFYRNPLHDFVAKSNIGFVELMIGSCIDLEMRNPNESPPLHFACRYGQIEMVQLLIKHIPRLDETIKTKQGETIFHFAVNNSDPQVPKLILDMFRFENLRDENGWTILHEAVAYGAKETIEFLIESRHKLKINIGERTNCGGTILHNACRNRDIEIVDLVLKALEQTKSDINLDTQNNAQETPLHYACVNKTSNVAINLLNRFPNKINVLGRYGMHVLHYTCQKGNLELLKYIVGNPDFDIDFNVVDESGCTPLHHACSLEKFEVVKFLLQKSSEKGIDISRKNNNRRTAEDLARNKNHKEILELFEVLTIRKTIEAYKLRLETLEEKHLL